MQKKLQKIFGILLATIASNSHAESNVLNNFNNAIKNGAPEFTLRPRYENAEQQGLLDSRATTMRTTVGYESADFYHTIAKVELVDVANFFGVHYNPGVSDLNKPQYTVINDPSGAGITEAKISYSGWTNNLITFGRQYIQLDNERFIGKNDLRQYPQSFDALSFNSTFIPNMDFYYAYVWYVNTNNANGRAAEGRRQLSTNLLNVAWDTLKYGKVYGYVYFNDDHAVSTNSNITFGARLASPTNLEETDNYAYAIEIARQQARFNNPNAYVAYYLDCNISKTIDILTFTAGIERLSGSAQGNNKAFITPLGSVDDFSGLAQVFTTTPARGLQDVYGIIDATYKDLYGAITYHYFRFDKGPGAKTTGNEVDISAGVKINEHFDLSVVYAKYNARNSLTSTTRRFWVMLTANLI